jgi:hypothetical protein
MLRRKESNCKRFGCVQPKSSSVWHTGLSGGAPDSVRCARLVSGEMAALGNRWRCTAKNHRTVRRVIRGEPVALGKRISDVRLKFTRLSDGAPDCPVSQRSLAQTVGRAIFARHVDCSNGQLVHRTVWCAPDSVRCANQPREATVGYAKFGRRSCTGQSTGPIRWRTGLSGAPRDRRQELPSKLASNGS